MRVMARRTGDRMALCTAAVLAIAAVIGACAGAGLPTVGEADVVRAQALFPEATRDRLVSGRQIYSQRCGRCHEPFQPATRTPDQWRLAVAEMSERARLHGERQALVLEYLQTFAAR